MPRRTYTKKVKLAAVMAADMVGVVQAEEQTGIPESTIRYWMDRPEFAEFRAKAREDLAEEVKVAAHLSWQRVVELAPTMEPRDAIFAAEKATTLMALLSGGATSRTELRDISGTISDLELSAALREAEHLVAPGADRASSEAEDPPTR